MSGEPPHGHQVDAEKVHAALDALATSGYFRVLEMEKHVPHQYWVMYVALHTFGCLGDRRDMRPLETIVRAWPTRFGGTEAQASSQFEAMMDWVIEHADVSPPT